MLKRSLSLVLALVLALGFIPFRASAATVDVALEMENAPVFGSAADVELKKPDLLNATVYERENNDTFAYADRFYVGDTVVGSLSYDDMDTFKFTVSGPGEITVLSLAKSSRYTYFGVWTSDYELLGTSTYMGTSDGYHVQMATGTLAGGTYYITVLNRYDYTDTYGFSVQYEYADVHTHSYTTKGETYEPTCEEDGYTEYFCSCGDMKKKDYVDALGHDYVAGKAVPGTCVDEGYTPYTCSRCDDSYNDDYTGYGECSYGSWLSDNNGTTDCDGTKTRTCKYCGNSETVTDTGARMPDVVMLDPTPQLGGNIIRWQAVEGAQLYQIFRLEGGSWVLLKNTGSLAYKDETAPIGVKSYYKVRARNGSLMSSMAIPSHVVTRPKLENVTITKTTPHKTGNILNWEAVEYANLYQVYRLEGKQWVLLKNTGSLAYKDETAPEGVKTYYKIVARYGEYKSDIGSTASASCTRPGDVLPNVTITGVNGHRTGNIIYWNAVDGATLYQVYRLDNGAWTLLKNTGSLSYKDETAPVGVKCYYKIVARNGNASSNIATTSSASCTRAAG